MPAARSVWIGIAATLAAGCAVEGSELAPAALAAQDRGPSVAWPALPDGHPPVSPLPEWHPPVRGRPLPEGHPAIPGLGPLPEGHPPVCPALSGSPSAPWRPSRPPADAVVRI